MPECVGRGIWIFLFPLIALSLVLTSVSIAAVQSSPSGEFNVTPDEIYLNWSNGFRANITVIANATANISITVQNTTNTITSNYSQENRYDNATYSQFWWDDPPTTPACFYAQKATEPEMDNPLVSLNASNASHYTNAANLTAGTNQSFMLWHQVVCPPGRYWGLLNTTNNTESAAINVTVDWPISTDNTLNGSTGAGIFMGAMPGNASVYHSYYFNTSAIANATGVTVNLSSSKDMDIFLLNQTGSLKAKSIERGIESLTYNYLPAGEIWEIRVYGNFSAAENYDGSVYFTTLNATKTEDSSTISLIDFGSLGFNSSSVYNITLRNEGNLTPTVTEAKEMYHIERFGGNTAANFTFLVPASASKVRASVNWSGGANYTLGLYKPGGVLAGNSTDKGPIANASGIEQEEWVESSSITEGLWEVRIANNTNITSPYNVTVKFWVSPDSWLGSNFTSMQFNATGLNNSNQSFWVNVTVPSNAISGLYEGYFRYVSNSGAVLPVLFRVNVTTPVLFVNGSFQSGSVQLSDNIGFNRSGTDVSFSVTINNTGNQVLNLTSSNSSNATLRYGSHFMNFSYNHPVSIGPGQSGTLSVNITINTADTGNAPGLYTGWIYLNSSNETVAHPYPGFNLSVIVNLTDTLYVNVFQINNSWVGNISTAQNVTPIYYVNYTNGTDIRSLLLENFTFWMVERNTSHRIPASGYLAEYNQTGGGGGVWSSGVNAYAPRVTVPANQIGGFYHMYVKATHTIGNTTLSGVGNGGSEMVIINNTGLNLTAVTATSLSITEGQSNIYFNVSVTNFGPKAATGRIYMTNVSNNAAYARGYDTVSGGSCGTCSSSHTYCDINIAPNGTETCWYRWRIYAHNVSNDETVTFNITTDESRFNTVTVSVLVDNLAAAEEEESTSDGIATCNSDEDCAASYYCDDGVCTLLNCTDEQYIADHTCVDYIYKINMSNYEPYMKMYLGGSYTTKVEVNNTGNGVLTAKLDVIVDEGITATVSPSAYSLDPGEAYNFTVDFSVANTTSSGNHSGTFKAYMSGKASSVYDTESFVVYVVPTEEREAEINSSYQDYLDILANLSSEFDAIKAGGFVSEGNLTRVQVLFEDANNLTQQIAGAIGAGNYVEAEALLRQLNSTFARIREELPKLKEEQQLGIEQFQSSLWVWGIAGVIIIAAAAFFVYMLLPPSKGYHPKYGFRKSSEHRERLEKIFSRGREHLEKAKELHKKLKRRQSYRYSR